MTTEQNYEPNYEPITFDMDIDKNKSEPKKEQKDNRKRSEVLIRQTKHLYRRAYSETQILDITPELKNGYTYNYITSGDIDALSYLKIILRQQKILHHVLFSTWCMAAEDVYQFRDWINNGKIIKLDAYVGEIFPSTYRKEWNLLKQFVNGRICVFKNHSKIFAGYGDKFYFGVQTSANINTNPRTENGCISIGKDIYDFYNNYFSKITSYI